MSGNNEKDNQKLERWVDYLEGELEPSLQEDLGLLLESDPELKKDLLEIASIRKCTKNHFETEDAEIDPAIFDRVHNNVMMEIKKVVPMAPAYAKWQRSSLAYAASLFLVLGTLAVGGYKIHQAKSQAGNRLAKSEFKQMLQTARVKDVSSLSEMVISHEDDMDLILNSGAERLENISQEELNAMFERL